MVKIAIQGHPTRGKEVIQILESLGGKNNSSFKGTEDLWYYINPKEYIRNDYQFVLINAGFKTYTLEEFEKEFPFKPGDTVIDKDGDEGCIAHLCNIDGCVYYSVKYNYNQFEAQLPKSLKLKKKEMNTRNITLTLEKAKEWYAKGGEFKEVALQAYSEEELTKVELPKTWEEFCDNHPVKGSEAMIDYDAKIIDCINLQGKREYEFKDIMPSQKSAQAHLALIQLEQLRDCYRQGDIPDFTKTINKYCIAKINKRIDVIESSYTSYFLSFTKKEVAKEFFTNFKPLIKIAEDYI